MNRHFQSKVFFLRIRVFKKTSRIFRKWWFSCLGMKIGRGTTLPIISVTWPHQVEIGRNCRLEDYLIFKFDGIWKVGTSINIGDTVFIGTNCEFNIRKGISVGNDSLIASGCRFIDHDHGVSLGILMREQHGVEREIVIGNNVWIGCNSVILKGVKIGDGAIVGAGSVVTKSIPADEIWAGIPARKIKDRQ